MRVTDVRERSVPISRYDDRFGFAPALDTSIVTVTIDAPAGPNTGFGFGSVGRFAQGGLIRERFAPRLLAADEAALCSEDGEVDPLRAWTVMMAGEKAGGHGERCIAVGALDMALWDLAAKRAGLPLASLLAQRFQYPPPAGNVACYASGGYRYPQDDDRLLDDEMRRMRAAGYERVKIKIGAKNIGEDLHRVEIVLRHFPASAVAVDAMNAYSSEAAFTAADALAQYGLWWVEDVCDPHDFSTHAELAARHPQPLGVGEPIFSAEDAALLAQFAGLRPDVDVLVFDPAHCYGIPGYARIVDTMARHGWQSRAFYPHGGHLFSLHVAAAFRLGGTEVNPFSFAPFGGASDGTSPINGTLRVPDAPGIGFETRSSLRRLFESLAA